MTIACADHKFVAHNAFTNIWLMFISKLLKEREPGVYFLFAMVIGFLTILVSLHAMLQLVWLVSIFISKIVLVQLF